MAQTRRGGRAERLARKFGIAGRGAVAAAVVAALAVFGVAIVASGALSSGGVVLERAAEAVEGEEGSETGVETTVEDDDAAVGDEGATETADEATDAAEAETLVVHVDGAVAVPGVYELPAGSRANDAVLAAGGLTEDADTSSLNLATPLSDGDKVRVPVEGEDVSATSAATTGITSSAEGSGTSASGDTESDGLVNINTATLEELDTLPGVGEATAQAIIDDREQNGPFSSIEDLMRVSGIGEKKFAKLEAMICV